MDAQYGQNQFAAGCSLKRLALEHRRCFFNSRNGDGTYRWNEVDSGIIASHLHAGTIHEMQVGPAILRAQSDFHRGRPAHGMAGAKYSRDKITQEMARFRSVGLRKLVPRGP